MTFLDFIDKHASGLADMTMGSLIIILTFILAWRLMP